jgi:hypothetical protein
MINEKIIHLIFNVKGYPGNKPPDIYIFITITITIVQILLYRYKFLLRMFNTRKRKIIDFYKG